MADVSICYMKIISRQEAITQGLKRYYTGKPCKHGHVAERHIRNGGCLECDRLREPEKAKRYRTKHPEKRKELKQRDYERRKEKVLAACAKYRKENAEKQQMYFKHYKKTHSGRVNAVNKRRDLAKKNRTPIWLAADDLWLIKEIYELAALRSKMTGFKWHVDHIVPLQGEAVSGLHVPSNLQVITQQENLRKLNRWDP